MTLPPTDPEGFLKDHESWNPEVAQAIAAAESLELTDAHWEVIALVRTFYADYGLFPQNRVLVSKMREQLGAAKGSSIYLMKLFSGKPIRVLAKVAGLPKPPFCE